MKLNSREKPNKLKYKTPYKLLISFVSQGLRPNKQSQEESPVHSSLSLDSGAKILGYNGDKEGEDGKILGFILKSGSVYREPLGWSAGINS